MADAEAMKEAVTWAARGTGKATVLALAGQQRK